MDNVLDFLQDWANRNGTIDAGDTTKLSQFMSELGTEIDKLSVVPENGGTNLILYTGNSGGVEARRIDVSSSKKDLHVASLFFFFA